MPDNLKDVENLIYPALSPRTLDEACQRVFSGYENDLEAFKNTGYPSGTAEDVVGLGEGEVDIHVNISDHGLFDQYTTVHLYATYQDTYGGNQGVSGITSGGTGDRSFRVSGLPSDGTQMVFDVFAYNAYIETPNKPELNKIGDIAGSDNIYPQNVTATDVSDATDEVEVTWDNPGGNPNDLDIRVRWQVDYNTVQTYTYHGGVTSVSWSGSNDGDDVRAMVNYVASDGSHYSSGYSNIVTNVNNSYQAPPQNLSAAAGTNCDYLFSWNQPTTGAPDHYNYELQWNNGLWGGGSTTTNTQTTIYGNDGDTLIFKVQAVNSSGYASDWVTAYVTYFCGGGGGGIGIK